MPQKRMRPSRNYPYRILKQDPMFPSNPPHILQCPSGPKGLIGTRAYYGTFARSIGEYDGEVESIGLPSLNQHPKP